MVASIVGCHSERVTSSPTSLREQEVVRLRMAAATSAPVVVGRVQALDEAGRYPLGTALVSVDGQAYYTNAIGAYRVPLTPGKHQLLVEHPGVRSSRLTVNIERGDSLQVNFYLRYAD